MPDDQKKWRESPDLLASLDALDAIELGDEDVIDTGEPYEEGYGGDVEFTPMLERPWARWMALLVAVAMAATLGYAGLRIILDWLGN